MNRAFPALRGIAIILVVLNHTITMGTSYAQQNGVPDHEGIIKIVMIFLSGLGIFAVPIFLFLSGCFFAYAANKDDFVRNYKIVRTNLLHVLIPYFVWSIIFYLEVSLLHEQNFTMIEYLKNLLVGYPFHFVPLLAFFYLISPILIRASRYIGGWAIVILIGVFQLFLLNIAYPGVLGFEFPVWANQLAPPVISNSFAEWGVFFPLGLIYVKTSARVLPLLQKTLWLLILITVGLYLIAVLDILSIVDFPLARYICPITLMLISPTLKRNNIPMVRSLEKVGKKAYGLYLMNLLVLDIILISIQTFIPGIFQFNLLLLPILFLMTLEIPMLLMEKFERFSKPILYRYVFG